MAPTLIAPLAVEEPRRERPFTTEMEKAAILCLSEVRRRKSGILRGTPEQTEYIAKLHYPLWAVPWEERCVIVDGLGLSSTAIVHNEIPNVVEFTEDLRRSSVSLALFRETLKRHSQTFAGFVSQREEVLDALIGRSSALASISNLVNQAQSIEGISSGDVVMVPPKYSREGAEERAARFVDEWRSLQAEADALRYAIRTLGEESGHHKEKISNEIEQVWKEYETRISRTKKPVEKRVNQLTEQKNKETQRAKLLQERKLKQVLNEEEKLRQKTEELTRYMKTQKRRRKDQRQRYPKRSTTRIDRRIESCQMRLDSLAKKILDTARLRKELERDEEETLRKIEEKYLGLYAKETAKLEILEQSRNLEVSGNREVIKEIEGASSSIEAQINQLMEAKAKSMKDLENLALKFRVGETTLVGVPFYLVHYKDPPKTRCDIYPPVTAASFNGVIKKIKKAILSSNLEARIQLLLNPRFPVLNEEIFANLRKLLETDPAFKDSISEIGRSRNLLGLPDSREDVAKGLGELEAEGWLNAKEKENILSIYSQ